VRLDESCGESTVVTAHNEVDRGESAECSLLASTHFVGDDAVPERIEGCSSQKLVLCVRSEIEVIERQL
jgi:hypothetical protein